MRRLARILGVIGGIGAILWAMRDRLVSVAIPREPQPPAFRVPGRLPDPAGTTHEMEGEAPETASLPQSVTDVSGIGPVYATRLEAAGVASLSDLANGDPEEVASAAEVPVGRAQSWIESARGLVEG